MAPAVVNTRGLPGYTFERAAGELWRCRFDAERNIIVVNSGHRDFVFATRNRALQLRYLVRLYVKELVLKNFAGLARRSATRAHDRAVPLCRRKAEIWLDHPAAECSAYVSISVLRQYCGHSRADIVTSDNSDGDDYLTLHGRSALAPASSSKSLRA